MLLGGKAREKYSSTKAKNKNKNQQNSLAIMELFSSKRLGSQWNKHTNRRTKNSLTSLNRFTESKFI